MFCTEKFSKIHRKVPVSKFLFDKVPAYNLKTVAHVLSCEFCEMFQNSYLVEHI